MFKVLKLFLLMLASLLSSCFGAIVIDTHRISKFCDGIEIGENVDVVMDDAEKMIAINIMGEPQSPMRLVTGVFSFKIMCAVRSEKGIVTDKVFADD